jgi:hypothetical protein
LLNGGKHDDRISRWREVDIQSLTDRWIRENFADIARVSEELVSFV